MQKPSYARASSDYEEAKPLSDSFGGGDWLLSDVFLHTLGTILVVLFVGLVRARTKRDAPIAFHDLQQKMRCCPTSESHAGVCAE